MATEAGNPNQDRMALRLTIEFSERDLEYYRGVLNSVCERNGARTEPELIAAARRLLEKAGTSQKSSSVRRRMDDLNSLNAMLDDRDWALDGEDRQRVVSVMRYFAEPLDMIPDSVPGLGFLDDVLMMELILRDLREELEAYRDFCRFRDEHPELSGEMQARRGKSLSARRAALIARMRRRRERRRDLHSIGRMTHPILQFRS